MKIDEEMVKLSVLDILYLCNLCKESKDTGDYSGCQKHFYKRQDRILNLLLEKGLAIEDRCKNKKEGKDA